jgi:hypothetical protein
LFTSYHYDSIELKSLGAGRHSLTVRFDPNFLARGNFVVRLALLGPQSIEYDTIRNAFSLLVAANPTDVDTGIVRSGTVRFSLEWKRRSAV